MPRLAIALLVLASMLFIACNSDAPEVKPPSVRIALFEGPETEAFIRVIPEWEHRTGNTAELGFVSYDENCNFTEIKLVPRTSAYLAALLADVKPVDQSGEVGCPAQNAGEISPKIHGSLGEYDVVLLDDPWIPYFMSECYLTPLEDFGFESDPDIVSLSANLGVWPPPFGGAKGASPCAELSESRAALHYAVPLIGNVMTMWFRSDVFEGPADSNTSNTSLTSITSIKQTFADLKTSEKVQKQIAGIAPSSNEHVYMTWLMGRAVDIYDRDLNVVLDGDNNSAVSATAQYFSESMSLASLGTGDRVGFPANAKKSADETDGKTFKDRIKDLREALQTLADDPFDAAAKDKAQRARIKLDAIVSELDLIDRRGFQKVLDGEAAMAVWWATDHSRIPASPDGGRIEVRAFPGEERSTSLVGNWLLGIPRDAPNKAAAFDFIQWATSAPVMRLSALRGLPPVRESLFTDRELVELHPWLPASREALENASPRPRISGWESVNTALRCGLRDAFTRLGHKKKNVDYTDFSEDFLYSMNTLLNAVGTNGSPDHNPGDLSDAAIGMLRELSPPVQLDAAVQRLSERAVSGLNRCDVINEFLQTQTWEGIPYCWAGVTESFSPRALDCVEREMSK